MLNTVRGPERPPGAPVEVKMKGYIMDYIYVAFGKINN